MLPAPAIAQTGYPTGPTTTTTPQPTFEIIDINIILEGDVIIIDVFGFAPFANVTFSLNGGAIFFNKQADANGHLTVRLELLDNGIRPGPAPAVVGLRHLFDVYLPSTVSIEYVKRTAKPAGQQNILELKGMGANGAPRTVQIKFTVAIKDAARGGTGFARTGVRVLAWTTIGGGLLLMGWFLVSRSRRRPGDSKA